jgi:hypothetical protein
LRIAFEIFISHFSFLNAQCSFSEEKLRYSLMRAGETPALRAANPSAKVSDSIEPLLRAKLACALQRKFLTSMNDGLVARAFREQTMNAFFIYANLNVC